MTIRLRVTEAKPAPPALPQPIPLHEQCLCPGCYFDKTRGSELCDRCTLDGCDHEENRHG